MAVSRASSKNASSRSTTGSSAQRSWRRPARRPRLVGRLFTDDVGRRASEVDPAAIVPSETLRRAGLQAAASLLLVAIIAFAGRATIRQAVDALSLRLFPSRIALEVTPGSVRLPSGSPLTIEARLVGNTAPVVAQVLRAPLDAGAEPADWEPVEMTSAAPATFTLALESVEASFRYRVAAGAARSEVFEVQVARPPRVARIDVEYSFPAALEDVLEGRGRYGRHLRARRHRRAYSRAH